MKLPTLKYSLRLSAFAAITSLTVLTTSNLARSQTHKGFECEINSGVPTTIYHNARGTKEPWIKWVSDHFSGANWTPLYRCKTVSRRLEEYRRQGKLRYVTLGMENDQRVICVASYDNGPCEGTIYTLKPGQDGVAALNNLFAWGSGQENIESSYETIDIPYINVESKLDSDRSQ